MENISSHQPLTSIFQSLSALSLVEIDQVMTQLIGLRKQKLPGVLSQFEEELLRKINLPVPSEIQRRYNYLVDLRKKEKLTDDEYLELIELTSYCENFSVRRFDYLLQLAKIRNISVDDLIDQLELKPQLNVA